VTDRFADSGGVRLRYRVDGPSDAPVLLLSHALGTSLDLWDQHVATFSRACRVIRYDTRGHGLSDVPAREYTIETLGRDALAVLDAERVETALVAGISLGGLTAMWLGSHAAGRVRALLLANTAARVGTRERWVERAALVRTAGMAAVADLAMGNWFTEAFREREPGTVERFRGLVASSPPDGYVGCCAALREADLRPDLARIEAPTLVIAGSRDPSTPLAHAQAVADRIPHATFRVFESAHLSSVECADAFAQHAGDFFRAQTS
jgi:3-oxoadipate enol-lactonase